ncbi:MAG: hypothetical protein AMJ46_01895 [Latescibacteria bacterium DG_63]|nr:MAG: hypothetical protein AMJ46_01895 [Latescibacteria bacterium DG_63]
MRFLNRRNIALLLGPVIFALFLVLRPPANMTTISARMAAVAALMAIWWIGEAIPIAATALLPLALFPILGIMPASKVAPAYGNHIVFLFLGGFIIAIAMQRWGLHRRIALHVIRAFGANINGMVLGFMVATAFLSLWISNTATTMMMLPIAMAVVTQLAVSTTSEPGSHDKRKSNRISDGASPATTTDPLKSPGSGARVIRSLGPVLMLAIAYSASIGGVGTLVGTPPNIIFAGVVRKLFPNAPEISFLQWMLIGLPVIFLFLPLSWLYLTRWAGAESLRNLPTMKGQRGLLGSQLKALGPISKGEKRVLFVFVITALLWISRQPISLGNLTLPGWSQIFGQPQFLQDSTVAVFMALLLFLIPGGSALPQRSSEPRVPEQDTHNSSQGKDPTPASSGESPLPSQKNRIFLMDWQSVQKGVPWGILILFGGGLALASGFQETGLAEWIGKRLLAVGILPPVAIIAVTCLLMTFLTEVTSNTAITTTMMPILAAASVGLRIHPFLLMIPATISSSCAFMLPVATPPNAIVFGSGWINIPRMARAGLVMNFMGVVISTVVSYFIVGWLFSLDTLALPSWALH